MKPLIALDIECLPNYFLIGFKAVDTGYTVQYECFGEYESLSEADRTNVSMIMTMYSSFGFNSEKYDIPMILYALNGATCTALHALSTRLILGNVSSWKLMKEFNLQLPPTMDHFDICEPAPAVMTSLKAYGTRIGSKRLWEFFVDPMLPIDRKTSLSIAEYNINDLDVTIDLYNAIKDRIELRVDMSDEYGVDLRSKSDAQIAEAVIVSELTKQGVIVNKPMLPPNYIAKYKAPSYISFKSEELKSLVTEIENIGFELASNGSLLMPPSLAKKKITIGATTYKLGIGGLHSQEKCLKVENNDTHTMRNADFASYYPFIILNNRLAPTHLGEGFLEVYRSIVDRRIKAKKEKNKLVDKSLKIVINGSFGKFGSKYSKLYSPDLLLATTITGQLTLLMIIEMFEDNGIGVVSANTDGLEYFCHKDKVELAESIVSYIESITGYTMEHGTYQGLYARDVNNYVAKYDGKVKAKGAYADPFNDAEHFLKKGLENRVVSKAVRDYILNKTPVEVTVLSSNDINDFLSARVVKGGGVWGDEYLGKMVRWYYSLDGKSINYKSNGNLVPRTLEGVTPMMNLSDGLPENLNFLWYINEAIDMLKDIGVDYYDHA